MATSKLFTIFIRSHINEGHYEFAVVTDPSCLESREEFKERGLATLKKIHEEGLLHVMRTPADRQELAHCLKMYEEETLDIECYVDFTEEFEALANDTGGKDALH